MHGSRNRLTEAGRLQVQHYNMYTKLFMNVIKLSTCNGMSSDAKSSTLTLACSVWIVYDDFN